ncbi:MAG: alcohol dehydrogenase catalytic domain-containing protein [Sphaerochaetaceae bacterium]|jgi:L-iditol 2-dehydrogenase|nr:alcohol dehydrogenase catalytic domain-containing protein [Sphaerochaetaceae bacterium]MDX9809151.1 alcohol dehydrogenase catalytic domain-containing protein [Sphaerochaetaceae bacterium]NLV84875.1 alcohol dehydrogenase catalytic domain-containing protein [Spirochaetales bacterium]
MKALMYTGIEQLELQQIPEPKGNFVIKVSGCGICGTDLKTYMKGHHFFKPPTILGHEFTGYVTRAPESSGFRIGDAVVVAPYAECGECTMCQRDLRALCRNKSFVSGGAFCEYVALPDDYRAVFKLPKSEHEQPDMQTYTLVEPFACVLNGVKQLAVGKHSRILIVGSGPMGALFALYFQQKGIPVSVVEPNESRRAIVASWDIDCHAPGEVDASQYDNIVIAVNKAELVDQYVKTIADGGTVLLFSGLKKEEILSVDSYAIHYRQVRLTGCSGFAMDDFHTAFDMISQNVSHYRRLITHSFPIEQGRDAFELLRAGKAFKVVIVP